MLGGLTISFHGQLIKVHLGIDGIFNVAIHFTASARAAATATVYVYASGCWF